MVASRAIRAAAMAGIVLCGDGLARQNGPVSPAAAAAARARARDAAAAPTRAGGANGGEERRGTLGAPAGPDGRVTVYPPYDPNSIYEGDPFTGADMSLSAMEPGGALSPDGAAAVVRASQTQAGIPANQGAEGPSISADGRYVAFSSKANNLITPDTNNRKDIFVCDLQTGDIQRVSDGLNGAQSDGDSYDAAISADGEWVAFTSAATNLVENDTNGVLDIFVVSRTGGGMRRANVNRLGHQTQGDTCNGCPNTSSWASISGDGRYVSFWSSATNLVEYPSNSGQFDGRTGSYIKDLVTGVVQYANVPTGGDPFRDHGVHTSAGYAWGYGRTAISPDGRYVLFSNLAAIESSRVMDPTMAPNAPPSTPGGNAYWFQPYIRDRTANITRQIARAPGNGHPAGGTDVTDEPLSASSDGGRAVFSHFASNLVADDSNGASDVFLFDVAALSTRRVSLAGINTERPNGGASGVLSSDGRFVAFRGTGNSYSSFSLWLRDVDNVVPSQPLSENLYGDIIGGALDPSISSTGQYTAFVGLGTAWVPGPQVDTQAYRRDRLIGIAEGSVDGHIYDWDTGAPIVGALVHVAKKSGTTNSGGRFLIEDVPVGEWDLVASAPGHHSRSVPVTLTGNSTAHKSVRLRPRLNGMRPEVVEVTSRYSAPDRLTKFLDQVSLQTTFTATIDWHGETPGRVVFITPLGEHDATYYSVTGLWQCDLDAGFDFGTIAPSLVVRAITSNDISSVDYRVNIEVIPPPFDFVALSLLLRPVPLSDALTYNVPSFTRVLPGAGPQEAVPAHIPLFGGKEMKVGTGIGVSGQVKGDGTASLSFSISPEKKIKLAGSEIGTSVGGGFGATYSAEREQWEPSSAQLTFGASVASFSVPKTPSYTVFFVGPVPVPVYWQASIGLGFGASLDITGIDVDSELKFTGTFSADPCPSVSVTGGVGAASLFTVYVTLGGSGKVSGTWAGERVPESISASLTLSGKFGAQFGTFIHEIPFLEYTFTATPRAGAFESLVAPSFRLVDREYFIALGGGNQFVANTAEPETPRVASMPGATDGAVGQTSETPIELNVFNESKAALFALGNDLLMVWQKDDATRTPTNRLELTWSYFSHATQVWSTPAPVADDGTADLRPQLARQPDGTVLCAWEDLKEVLAEPLDPMDPAQVQAKYEEFKSKTEISTAVFDPMTQSWGAATRLTDNALFEHSPKPSVANDGTALVMWVSNAFGNEIGSVAQPNSVWGAWRAAGVWQAPGEAAMNVPSIIKCVALLNPDDPMNAYFAYSADTDDNPATIEDWELFSLELIGGLWKGPFQQTFNTAQEVGPSGACWGCFYAGVNVLWAELPPDPGGTSVYLGWPTGGNDTILTLPYAAASAGDIALGVGPEQYLNYLVFQDQSDDLVDLSYIGYDPIEGFWSAPRRLTADRLLEVPTAVAVTGAQEVVVAYNKTAMGSETRIVNNNGEKVEIEVPVREGTDLYVLRHAIHGELAIGADDISIDLPNPLPGFPFSITATLHNMGDIAAWGGAFDVAFYNGDPNNGGVPLALEDRIGGTAVGGGVGIAELSTYWPWGTTSMDIYIVVDPLQEWPDTDRSNNIAHRDFTLLPDMTVQSVTADTISPTDREVVARVQNAGSVESPATTCVIREQEQRGGALVTLQVPPLPPGAFADLPWVWPGSANLPGGSFALSASVDEEDLIAEFDESNNSTTAAAHNNLPPTAPCEGDANGDGTVDFLDLNIVLSDYGQTGAPGSLQGDLDNDGDCDFVDLNIVLSNYGVMC